MPNPTLVVRALALIMPLMLAFIASPATAAPTPATVNVVTPSNFTVAAVKVKISKSVEKKIRAGLKANGVKASVRDSLVKKLKAGKRWDSTINGKKPKSTKIWKSADYRFSRLTFADGSVLIQRITLPKNLHTQMTGSWSDCGAFTTDHYYVTAANCRFWESSVLFSVEFTFDYAAAPGYRKIINPRLLTGGGVQDGPQNLHFESVSEWDLRAYFTQTLGVGDVKLTMPYFAGVRITSTGGWVTYTG